VPGGVGDGDTAIGVGGTGGWPVVNTAATMTPGQYSIETWFNTTSAGGGKLVGFADNPSGPSLAQDKHLYLTPAGQVGFGVWNNHVDVLLSRAGLNDGSWHQVVATQGPAGMSLYVDGALAGSNTVTTSQVFVGDWQIGGQINGGWPGIPAGAVYTGLVDDTAIYPAVLTPTQVGAHWSAAHPTPAPLAPVTGGSYPVVVGADHPGMYLRLADTGPQAFGLAGAVQGVYAATGLTRGAPGAVGDGNPSIAVTGTGTVPVVYTATVPAPAAYTIETWFNTTSTGGGKLVGFADNPTGPSGAQDKHLYLTPAGQVGFGVWNGHVDVLFTPKAGYNDGRWHHAVGTQGPAGMVLYIDGDPVATNTVTTSQVFTGDWQIGGQINGGWPGTTPGGTYTGLLDETATYPTPLTPGQIRTHYTAAHPS
jgi:large repetitive protein